MSRNSGSCSSWRMLSGGGGRRRKTGTDRNYRRPGSVKIYSRWDWLGEKKRQNLTLNSPGTKGIKGSKK